ncbi:RWD domain-containing protein 4 [Acropora cervicornis]|uniref:RWD domain-containing protein 4 n=1 Tax=Acropora cervicornis TaxID=6130 RepID=A0AAD9PT89_ACRCE|nr:RWD domain-containing protein 4 [Acropora cervicornis]
MSCEEDQEDEREALRSIYESDENFIEINPTTFQYKFGDDGHFKSFLLEVSWPDDYPTCFPNMNLDAFYNKHISCHLKESIKFRIKEQFDMCVGSAVTYSIFDWTMEHQEELMAEQQEQEIKEEQTPSKEDCNSAKKKEKKENLTKSQKRRLADKTNHKGERERGWNWVDVVKHLSKSGQKD